MRTSGFRERLTGALLDLGGVDRLDLPPRGPRCGNGLLTTARSVYEQGRWMRPRDGNRFAIRGLEAVVIDAGAFGFTADVGSGTVTGILGRPLPVLAGFADLRREHTTHRLCYRLLVPAPEQVFILEGVKDLRLGLHRTWWEVRSLVARVVRVSDEDAIRLRSGDARDHVAAAWIGVRPVMVGLLRVRALDRRMRSVRRNL